MNKDKKYKVFFAFIVIIIIGVIGIHFFWKPNTAPQEKYTREATRQTIDLAETEFVNNLKHGNSYVDKFFGGSWTPMVMPIAEKYTDLLKEKIVFIKDSESITEWTELLVIDTYADKAFPTISSYLKKHANELHNSNPEGRIKILHDGDKGIMYQWVIPNSEGNTTYMEFGWVEMTNEGLLSIKYLNKGTSDLELQRQKAIKFFTKFAN